MKPFRCRVPLRPLCLLLGLSAWLAVAAHAQAKPSLTDEYRDVAGRIVGAALEDTAGWAKFSHLTTEIGNRLSGSLQLEQAIAWAEKTMRAEGLDNVRLQPVKVPHWVRGTEYARMTVPREKPLAMLGLGGSVATPPDGITAPVVVVHSFDELAALGRERVAGKIVLYNVPFTSYGPTVRYRESGAARAAELGAVAMLLRSVTPRSMYTPHTGTMDVDKGQPPIPAAAITIEDAELIDHLVADGQEVRVKLYMEAHFEPDADSANVMGEIIGSEKPDEVVVLGGHFDSWDVGQGAEDDGAGVMAAWEAVTLLRRLGLHPRRTIRVVLWTNEENGTRGGNEYRRALGDDVAKHVAAIEMDGGAEKPVGFGFGLSGVKPESNDPQYEAALAKLKQVGALLEGIEAGEISRGGGGADIGPLMKDGVPGLALRTVGEHYFDWHHTDADTLDKIDPQQFRKCVAMLAVMSYVLADMPDTLVPPKETAPAK